MYSMTTQLEAIHSMLAAGHRSIRMPRHSLILWGIAAGVLCLATEQVITPERFPGHWLRAVAMLIFLGLVLSAVAFVDYQYTRYRIRLRDESLPFVQAQITKVWWLLIGMGVLFTFGTAFFGGGYMVFVIWLVLFGLGIYIHGLFSEEILEWTGVMMILLGVAALALPASYLATKWLAASVFGVGMPLLSAMLDSGQTKSTWTRALQSATWLAVVLGPMLGAYHWWKSQDVSIEPRITLESFLLQPNAQTTAIVTLPEGTDIPLSVHISGDIVRDSNDMTLFLTLAKPIEVVIVDGKPNGGFRVADGQWKQRASLWLAVNQLDGALTPGKGPAASMSLTLTVDR